MRNVTAEADTDEGATLYDQIVDASGIEYPGEFPSAEAYKDGLVKHFGHIDPDEFDVLPDELRDWVNEATLIYNANRRAKDRSPLPDIEGLPEPPPPKVRRTRVSISDDDDEVEAAPPPPTPIHRPRIVAAPPEDEDEDEGETVSEEAEPEDEPEPPPPPRAARTRAARPAPAPAPSRRQKRDPDAGRYAKVMPHYLKHREIDVPELQEKIAKTDGATYSETTLDRTLAACVAVVGWLERNGVNLDRLSK